MVVADHEWAADAYRRVNDSGLNVADKVDLLKRFFTQITSRSDWEFAGPLPGSDGSQIFTGPGNAAVIDTLGRIFTGRFPGPGFQIGANGVTPIYNALRPR